MINAAFAVIKNEKQRSELEKFYLEHKDRFHAVAMSKLHNNEDAEDAVQEVFSEIADKPEKFFELPPNYRLLYINVMVKNVSVEMYKSKKKVPVEDLTEELEDVKITFENDILDKISRDELVAFMKRLPEAQKIVLQLHCYFGLTLYEVSQKLNISLMTANKRLASARKAICKFLDERNADHE